MQQIRVRRRATGLQKGLPNRGLPSSSAAGAPPFSVSYPSPLTTAETAGISPAGAWPAISSTSCPACGQKGRLLPDDRRNAAGIQMEMHQGDFHATPFW
jgi:predicted small lipoprotein YifL